jgi:hypothetical protein
MFQEIAPQNKNVQKQIFILSNSKNNYIRQWNQIQPPKFTELEIRELCTSYYKTLENTNEERLMQGLPRIALVDIKNWVVKIRGKVGIVKQHATILSRYFLKEVLISTSCSNL